jgi:ankyrin repeat protein
MIRAACRKSGLTLMLLLGSCLFCESSRAIEEWKCQDLFYLKKAKIKALLEAGCSPDTRNYFKRTPLHEAAGQGQKDLCEILLAGGATIDARDYNNQTPLFYAVLHGQLELADWLIEQGADFKAKTRNGQTILHLAAAEGHLKMVKSLAARGAAINPKPLSEWTPLGAAAWGGHTTVVDWLIKNKAELNAVGPYGTPLCAAASGCSLESVKLLVDNGAAIAGRSGDGRTALLCSTQPSISRFLLSKGAKVDSRDNQGASTLHLASNIELAKMLLAAGADIEAVNNDNEPPLVSAVTASNHEVLRYLLELGAKVNYRDKDGKSALRHATDRQDAMAVQLLLAGGADPNSEDLQGKKPTDGVMSEEIAELFKRQKQKIKGVPLVVMGRMKVMGSLDRELIRKTILRHKEALHQCMTSKAEKGIIVLKFIIYSPTGYVRHPKVLSSDFASKTSQACLLKLTKLWRFPHGPSGLVIVELPIGVWLD